MRDCFYNVTAIRIPFKHLYYFNALFVSLSSRESTK